MSRAFVVAGYGFGDEGKGRVVDALTRKFKSTLTVRYNGGGQAAHNVVTPDGKHHTFAQFGAGTLAGASTLLSRFMLFNPMTLYIEWQELQKITGPGAMDHVFVDARAMVTTPYHRAMNRIAEIMRGKGRHGSCGMGVGDTVDMAIKRPDLVMRAVDLKKRITIVDKLMSIRSYYDDQLRFIVANWKEPQLQNGELKKQLATFSDEVFAIMVDRMELVGKMVNIIPEDRVAALINAGSDTTCTVFEGAQGALIDENIGFPPYNTWSTTTMHNAYTILREVGFKGEIKPLAVTRFYMTRHGPGPFVTESQSVTATIPDQYNGTGRWQGEFRSGWPDMVALGYSLRADSRPDAELVVTHCDYIGGRRKWRICTGYEYPHGDPYIPVLGEVDITQKMFEAVPVYQIEEPQHLLDDMARRLSMPIAFTTWGQSAGLEKNGTLQMVD